jgi:hypothetical protein
VIFGEMNGSYTMIQPSQRDDMPFFSHFHEWEALTFEILYARMSPSIVDTCQPMARVDEGLQEQYHDFLESQRYVA